jgi:hypothetical protein
VTLTFRSKNTSLADHAVAVLKLERPMTLRQLFYRVVSAGLIANTPKEYKRLGRVMTQLREAGRVPFTWIVDHVRTTLKPSSWSGLADYGDTIRRAYRKDLWASMPHHVEVFVEKDAIAGTIQPVTREFDVALQVCRGYASLSFVGEIAEQWKEIEKPIYAYYLGDYDPSGFDIERDLQEKLATYSGLTPVLTPAAEGLDHHAAAVLQETAEDAYGPGWFQWTRLAVKEDDFDDHDLIELPVKMSDNRAGGFREVHGDRCAEVDALPPTELRRRVKQVIEAHIDPVRWGKLQEVERLEKETLVDFVGVWKQKPNLGSVSPEGGAA